MGQKANKATKKFIASGQLKSQIARRKKHQSLQKRQLQLEDGKGRVHSIEGAALGISILPFRPRMHASWLPYTRKPV